MMSPPPPRILLCALVALACTSPLFSANGPSLGTGIRIGEVTAHEALVWTRLTARPERVGPEAPMPEILYRNPETGDMVRRNEAPTGARRSWPPQVVYPEGYSIETIEGAVPGAPGRVRILFQAAGRDAWRKTGWETVDPARDFTRQFTLSDLQASTRYHLKVETQSLQEEPGATLTGGFVTAPAEDEAGNVTFTVSTGQAYPDQDVPGGGFKIYPQMLKLDPDFFVHTGDIVYYDSYAKSLPLARWHWARTYSLSTNLEFHRQVGSYFIKDDHDTWMNDCWPGMESEFMGEFTFEQGQQVFLEQVPMAGPKTYRTFRWGRDLQIWLVEGRDYRSPNTMEDGPGKTIWGAEQKAWFMRTVEASEATFRVLISPTPLVGPDRTNKKDNHSNSNFAHEGQELRDFIGSQKNMYVVCGDRHWQYVSEDAATGLWEFSCGPASNEHAGGWSDDQRYPEHRYLKVTGGFLAGTVAREAGKPVLVFRHYSVEGEVLHEERLPAP